VNNLINRPFANPFNVGIKGPRFPRSSFGKKALKKAYEIANKTKNAK
jgi:hypothetical protein